MHRNSHRRSARGFIAFGLTLALAMLACTLQLRPVSSAPTVDSSATTETKALFLKLYLLSGSNQTLFGHQDDTFFGVGWTQILHAALLFYIASRSFRALNRLWHHTPRAKLALKLANRLEELGELDLSE